MSTYLSKELIEEIANEIGVHPSFVEKDYYAVQILAKISHFSCLGFSPVFSGGTCLSKAYSIIQRFSEDLDFSIYGSKNLTKAERKQIRHKLRSSIEAIDTLAIRGVQTRNEGKIETITIEYPALYEMPRSLRRHLKLELFFEDETNDKVEKKTFTSFIGTYINEYADFVHITCNCPFNIMADKITAIAWRVYSDSSNVDYTLMRHLHDIFALAKIVPIDDALRSKVLDAFEKKDKARLKGDIPFTIVLEESIDKLSSAQEYQEGYKMFVNSMSYSTDAEQISFEEALRCFQSFSTLFK